MSVAAISKSSFVSAYADTGDTTRFGPTAQAAAHLFTGGNTGDLLTRDPTTATGAAWSPSLPPAQGGTGITSFTIGDLLYASSASVLSKLAAVAAGQVLISAGVGVAPAWSASPVVQNLTVNGSFSAGNLILANAGALFWLNRTFIESIANGQLNIDNNAASAGIGFDVNTDAVLKIRTRAQSAYATLDCLGLKASGAAGASFGPAAVASITVVNGIITAIS